MDLQRLKQQQQQHESDQQQSDLTRLLLNDCYYQQHHSNCSELSLFTSPDHHQSSTKLNLHSPNASVVPTSSRIQGSSSCSYFSMAQWQELEVQACIYRHMVAGAPVPPQLLHLVKKSLILNSHSSSPYYHSSPYNTPLLLSGGYWGRGGMDPEPGRCRRTDGKKWRCSRDIVGGYKYCERHMHRGRNRSRKPVESPTPTPTVIPHNNNNNNNNSAEILTNANTNQIIAAQPHTSTTFGHSGPSHSLNLLPLNQRSSGTVAEAGGLYRVPKSELSEVDKSGSQVLRPFFDDWPRSIHESQSSVNDASLGASLSISVPGNSSSDFSLKLSTGGAGGGNPGHEAAAQREEPQLQWGSSTSSWGTNQMGGPLAEALRSSAASTSSPTSVLHQLRGTAHYIGT